MRTWPKLLTLVGLALFQQIGSVDLTLSAPPSVSHNRPIPAACEHLNPGGIGDGWPEPEGHKPRHIEVAVLSVKDEQPALDSEVEATVQLRNIDTHSIQVPWSTDPSVIEEGQNEDYMEWETGTFEFFLRDQARHRVMLKSSTEWLHGSKFVPGSLLTIQPGQSIAALVKFKVEDLYPIGPLRLKEGTWQLSVEWRQVGRTWHIKDCAAWNGYFHYDHFYEQQSPPFSVQITAKRAQMRD
jgi:hypothetical protein